MLNEAYRKCNSPMIPLVRWLGGSLVGWYNPIYNKSKKNIDANNALHATLFLAGQSNGQ